MFPTQKFALEKIYCSPSLDRQFSFSLKRVNKEQYPVKNSIRVYNVVKHLPNKNNWFHVFVIGNLNPNFLNLLHTKKDWFRDIWINVAEDMVERNYIFNIYNSEGVMYPRNKIYYSFIDEHSLVIALEFDTSLKTYFDITSFKYINVYSNYYFRTYEFNSLPVKHGIKYNCLFVTNNLEKVQLQNEINNYISTGNGKALIYVNGYYTDNLNLNISDNSYIEYVYDQSILSKEQYNISELRTFDSILDNKLKYLLFRNINTTNSIQFFDDCDIYISTKNELVTKGVFYYIHNDYAFRNVTDKDYSLYTSYVNNLALGLSAKVGGSLSDKVIVLFTRKSGIERNLIYSSLKLHELYKLPLDKQKNVILSNIYSLSDYRAETLENSDYLKLSRLPHLSLLTTELVNKALGYNGLSYYFANTPNYENISSINVPLAYQSPSTAFEYDNNGKFIGTYTTTGPIYIKNNSNCRYVEFLYGRTPNNYGKLYSNNETIDISGNNSEFRILSAYYSGVERISNYIDITENTSKCTITPTSINLNLETLEKARIIFFNQPLVYDLSLQLIDGLLYFPLTITEDRGTGLNTFPLDTYFLNIEIYLNGYKLTKGLDYFIKFPYVNIVTKKYINYNSALQNIHIRCYGFTMNKNDINKTEKVGFIHHGVLLRNKKVDLFDDKVVSVYIDGKLYRRDLIRLAENDNTVRVNDQLNGLPYIVKKPFIPVKHFSNGNSVELFNSNLEKDIRIENLFNNIYPEIEPSSLDMSILNRHYVFSSVVTKIVSDILDNNIPSSLYTSPYNDNTIISLLNQEPYKTLYELDPIRNLDLGKSSNLVEIHPTSSNTTISLNLFQYRFIQNVIRVITTGRGGINRINMSGHFTVTT